MRSSNRFIFIAIILLLVSGIGLAQQPRCGSNNIAWLPDENTIEIVGDVACTISEIKAVSAFDIPLELVDEEAKIWFLGAHLIMTEGASFYITGGESGDVNELQLMSASDGREHPFVVLGPHHGFMEIRDTQVYSIDPINDTYDTDISDGRANIQAISFQDDGVAYESTLNIFDSEISYLGYHSGESYGISWKVKEPPERLDFVNVYGTVENTVIHHNYYGAYSFGAQDMIWRNNEFHSNIEYGLDPHDDSDYLLIEGNYAHHNGNHGIICSKRCNNLIIRNNVSEYNEGHGIMLHRHVNHTLVEHNTLRFNTVAGIAIFDSHNNTIQNNIIENNRLGIRVSRGSSYNIIQDNTITSSSEHGIYLYSGFDEPTINNGNPQNNDFLNNTITATTNYGIKISQAEFNTFKSNRIEDSLRGINMSGELIDGNDFMQNTIVQSQEYGIRASNISNTLISENTITDTETAIRIDGSDNNIIERNIVRSADEAFHLANESSCNFFVGNSIQDSQEFVTVRSGSDNTLSGNTLSSVADSTIYLDEVSTNTVIENMPFIIVHKKDETSTFFVRNTNGQIIYTPFSALNSISGTIVDVDVIDSPMSTITFQKMNISLATDQNITFTPMIWNLQNLNIVSWETNSDNNNSIQVNLLDMPSETDYDILINGSLLTTLTVATDGTLNFEYEGSGSQIVALIRVIDAVDT